MCALFTPFGNISLDAMRGIHYLGPIKSTYKKTDNWTTYGMWVVGNQQAWLDGLNLLDGASDEFAALAEGLGLTVLPSVGRETFKSFRIPCNNASESDQIAAWNNLYYALANPVSRNFFYLGHGGPSRIGTNDFCGISADDITVALHNVNKTHPLRHVYRFVFLYGCETTSGRWPEAFGIEHRENIDMMHYIDNALRPSTFVGIRDKNRVAIGYNVLSYNAEFLLHFLDYRTMYPYGVKEALTHAANHPLVRGYIKPSDFKVFGYWDQGFSTFNR